MYELFCVSLETMTFTLTPHSLAADRVISWISCAMASRFSMQSCNVLAPKIWRNVVCVLKSREQTRKGKWGDSSYLSTSATLTLLTLNSAR